MKPSVNPTIIPTIKPSFTTTPSTNPSIQLTLEPTVESTVVPTVEPTIQNNISVPTIMPITNILSLTNTPSIVPNFMSPNINNDTLYPSFNQNISDDNLNYKKKKLIMYIVIPIGSFIVLSCLCIILYKFLIREKKIEDNEISIDEVDINLA